MINTQNLSQDDYENLRFELLNQLETSNDINSLLNPILDSVGIPTIGIGLNLRDSNSQSIVFETFGIDPENPVDAPFAEQLIEVIESPFEDGQEDELQVALDAVMSERAEVLENDRTTFAFSDRNEAIEAFNERVDSVDELIIDTTVPGISNSLERATLVSLAFNGGTGLVGPNLRAAIASGDRAEAWYEIRYNSGISLLSRRFVESEIFGLYDDSSPSSDFRPTEANALLAARMFTRHEVDILEDDLNTASFDIANGNLDAIDERVSIDLGRAETIFPELQPAQTVLIDNFSTLPEDVRDQLQRFEPDSFLNTPNEIDNVFVSYEGTQFTGEVAPNTVDRTEQPAQNDLIFGSINTSGSTTNSDDTLKGAGGNDLFIGGLGNDSHDGGAGEDTVSYQGSPEGVNISLSQNLGEGGYAAGDSYAEIENVIGSNNDDTLVGNNQSNILVGLNGQDRIDGEAGNDYLLGGDGDDTLVGGNGINILTGGADNDRFILNPEEGIDIITDFNASNDLILLPNDLEFSQLSFAQAENSTDAQISLVNNDQVIGTLINIDAESITTNNFAST